MISEWIWRDGSFHLMRISSPDGSLSVSPLPTRFSRRLSPSPRQSDKSQGESQFRKIPAMSVCLAALAAAAHTRRLQGFENLTSKDLSGVHDWKKVRSVTLFLFCCLLCGVLRERRRTGTRKNQCHACFLQSLVLGHTFSQLLILCPDP